MTTDSPNPKKILLVDDNPTDIEILKRVLGLKSPQFYVQTAYGEETCRAHVEQETFDLIIMDINLAGGNGIELCRQIKSSARGKQTKVIVCSGALDRDFILYAKDAGAHCVLAKDESAAVWQHAAWASAGRALCPAAPDGWSGVQALLLNIPLRKEAIKVLMIDDEPDFLKFAKLRLESLNFEVITAQNGPDGVAKAVQDDPDVILLDMMMPEFDGIEVCQVLKKINSLKSIPVIFLSCVDYQPTEMLGKAAGAHGYITKPFEIDKLSETIGQAHAQKKTCNGNGRK